MKSYKNVYRHQLQQRIKSSKEKKRKEKKMKRRRLLTGKMKLVNGHTPMANGS